MEKMTLAEFNTLSTRDFANGVVQDGIAAALADRERLSAIVGRQQRTADDVLVEDGKTYYFRCANGILKFVAYLGPVSEYFTAYPWDEGFSTPEAAETEGGE